MPVMRYPSRRALRRPLIRVISLWSILTHLILSVLGFNTYVPTQTLDLLSQLAKPVSESHPQESAARALLTPDQAPNSLKYDRPQWLHSQRSSRDEVNFTPHDQLASSQSTKRPRESPREDPRSNEEIGPEVQTVLTRPFGPKSNGEIENFEPFKKQSTRQASNPSLAPTLIRSIEVGDFRRQDAQLGPSSSHMNAVTTEILKNIFQYRAKRSKHPAYPTILNAATRVQDHVEALAAFGDSELLSLGLQEDLNTLLSDLEEQWSEKALRNNILRDKRIENMRSVVAYVTKASLAQIRVISESYEPAFFKDEDELEENQRQAFRILFFFWKELQVPGLESRKQSRITRQERDSTVEVPKKRKHAAKAQGQMMILKTEESDAAGKIGQCIGKVREKRALVWTAVAYWMREKQPELYEDLGSNAELDNQWKTLITDMALFMAGCGIPSSTFQDESMIIYKLQRN